MKYAAEYFGGRRHTEHLSTLHDELFRCGGRKTITPSDLS
jgi:hypothetical protein